MQSYAPMFDLVITVLTRALSVPEPTTGARSFFDSSCEIIVSRDSVAM